jgi:hypothetical protein
MAHEEPILPTPRAATVEDYRAVLKQARDFISFLKGDEYTVAGHCIDQVLAMPNPAPSSHVKALGAAKYLLWYKDNGGNTDHCKEAWDTLRAALATEGKA